MKGKFGKKRIISIAAISVILIAAIVAIVITLFSDLQNSQNVLPDDYKAFSDENPYKNTGEYVKPELDVDGVLEEEQWKDLETREVTGAASATVKAFYGKDGIYVGAVVSDTDLWGKYDYVNVNSSFEFYLDTKGDGGAELTNDNAWFTVDVNGDRMVREGRKGKWNDSDLLALCATKIDGTLDDKIADKGYTVEMYIPYSEIGGKPENDYRIGFGVRKCGFGSWGTASRIGGMSNLVPDTFYTFSRETNSFLDAKKITKATARIDGKDTDKIWNKREKYTFINGGTVSSNFAKEGLYLFFEIVDDKAFAKGTNPSWNDGVEIYLDTKDNGGKKPKEDDAQIRVDLLGRVDFMTGTKDGWVVRKDNVFAAARVIGGKLNSSCTSYNLEVFIPWSDLGLKAKPKKMGVNFGVNDWDGITKPDGTREKRWEGIGEDPQVPNKYIRLTHNFEKVNYAKYKIDGKINDEIWKKRNKYQFVSGGTVSNYFAKEGVYFLFEMKDDKICADQSMVPTQNDSVGLYLDPKRNGGEKPQKDDVQINVDVAGRIRFLVGTGSGWKYAINDTLAGVQTLKNGYRIEIFVPWSDLGLKKKPTNMKFSLDHVDWDGELKEDGKHKTIWSGIGANPQIPDEYIVLKHNFKKVNYSKYKIDGKASDKIWENRKKYDFVNGGTISNYFAKEGVYFLFEMKDDKICADGTTVTQNDSIGLYLDPKCNGGEKPQKDDVQINVDVAGNMRFLAGTGGGWKYVLNDTLVGVQTLKSGYRVEIFIPWADLGLEKKPQQIMGSFDHIDWDGDLKDNGNRATKWTGIGADPQVPDNYIRITHKFEKINYANYKVNGKTDDSIWKKTKPYGFSYGRTIRHYFAKEGIYFFFSIKDSLVCAEGKAAYLNDSVGIYLDTQMNGGTQPQSDDVQITVDAAGNMRFLKGNGKTWVHQDNDVLLGVKIVDGKLNQSASGYNLEVFVPWADLGHEKAPSAMKVSYDNVDWNGVTKSDGSRRTTWLVYGENPQSPDTYITIDNGKKQANTGTNIDIYLIAGQSNAAGFSSFDKNTLKEINAAYINGFDNVYYAGTACNPTDDGSLRPFHTSLTLAKAGSGRSASHMGPEVGMAEALSSVYNETTGNYAGFIKYAVGGTSLMNVFTGQNQASGNWVSPSYADTLNKGITAKTGCLYYKFLTEVQIQMEAYRQAGFNPIIKGMYWMQGENDIGKEAEYVESFTCFVNDMRKDLSVQTGQDLTNMPFVVGEISRTFSSATEEQIEKNAIFIEMQNTLPSKITNCYVIKSSVYDMNTSEGVVGTDRYHWNYKDCIAVGKLVGECLKNIP